MGNEIEQNQNLEPMKLCKVPAFETSYSPNLISRKIRQAVNFCSIPDQDVDITEEAVQTLKLKEEGTTKVVEEGAFTISSTVGIESSKDGTDATSKKSEAKDDITINCPSPRFGSLMAIDKGLLYLFGGMVEDSNDKQLTHKDFYALGTVIQIYTVFSKYVIFAKITIFFLDEFDTSKLDKWSFKSVKIIFKDCLILDHCMFFVSDIHKMDEWETLIESDIKTLKLEDSDLSDDDEDDESDSDEDSEEMDVS